MIALRAVALGCVACLALACAPPQRPWNVLVVVPDTVRADHLSTNGYGIETPHLDALAADGVNFSQAITVAPRTFQSFASILTGLYPPHHGVRYLGDWPLAPDTPTLASELAAAGHVTAVFDRVTFIRRITAGRGFGFIEDASATSDRDLLEAAWDWIAEQERPFFAFVRMNGPHWPYGATPEQMADLDTCQGKDHRFNEGGWSALGIAAGARGKGLRITDPEQYRRAFFDYDYSEETIRHMIAHYDAGLRRTDADIGWLIDRLRESGLLDETVVVVTSDHGESFGEHGYLQHGARVDEPVLRVPLIVRLPPGHPSRTAPRTVDQQVRTVDIAPTLLDALGRAVPEGLDGISLLPAIAGGALPAMPAYAESGRDFVGASPDVYLPGIRGKRRAIRHEGWKLVYIPKPGGAQYQLFDLANDPGEARDVAATHPERVALLRAVLDPILADDPERPARELSDEVKEQLRALGYL